MLPIGYNIIVIKTGHIFEFKFDFGSGYRVYFAVDGDEIILLLMGGDKSSQRRDIEKARQYWTDYLMRKLR